MYNDIFISYRNDMEGRAAGRELKTLFERAGYSVYFNPDERTAQYFPDELKEAVLNCKDFVMLMTDSYLQKILINESIDWIREEITLAHDSGKHFIPILFDGVTLPEKPEVFPEKLRYLYYMNYIMFPADTERFAMSPFTVVEERLYSRPEKGETFRATFNSNSLYDVNEDFQKNIKAASEGDIEAIYELALNYFYGYTDGNGHSKRDYAKAYECFLKLSESNNPHQIFAINMIGHMYYGATIPGKVQSYEESLKRHILAAETIKGAADHVAYMLSIGSGCDFDYNRTVHYYEKLIEKGDIIVKYHLAEFYCEYGEFIKAAELYECMYETMPEAAIQLGKLYKRGVLETPPKPDYSRAALYFQYAIDIGNCGPEPYYELGRLYFNPTGGFPKNFRLAQKNFQIAADKGHADAQYMLGYMYDSGHVEHNIDKAIYYHELAAKQGHVSSTTALITLYQQPEHVNYHRAFKYAQIAASCGSAMGEFLFANLLFFGRGCNADMNEAYKYYKLSYEHGFEQSKIMMEKINQIIKSN